MLRSAADSFVGSHTNKIDAKGRIAAPADFRKALDLKAFKGFFCVPSLEGPFLDCGGPDYVETLKAMIYALPPYDPDRRALETNLLGQMRPIPLDADGRFVMPEPLRRHAGLTDLAYFVGIGDTFQIWKADGAEKAVADTKEQARLALRRLSNPGAPPQPAADGPGPNGGAK